MGQRISTPAQLRQAIGQGLPPLTWVSGDELLLVIEAADLVRARARKLGFEEREVLDIDARFDRSRLVEATQSTSLFASQRLIDLRLNTKPTRELGDALRELLPRLDDGTRVLVSSAHLERATTSTAWFEALAKQMLWVETPRIDASAMGKWVTERLAAQKQQATPAVLALITERTEGNLLAAHQAIQRLGLLLPPGELPLEAVAEIVLDSARFELFGLVDAIRKRLRIQQALQIERVAPAQAMRAAGVFGKREAIMRQALRRLDIQTLGHLLQQVARLDRMTKGVGGTGPAADPWFHAETLLVALAGGHLPGPVELSAALADD